MPHDRPPRVAFLPAQPSDFVVTVGGREVRWLSRIVGTLLAPIVRWRMRRGRRPGGDR